MSLPYFAAASEVDRNLTWAAASRPKQSTGVPLAASLVNRIKGWRSFAITLPRQPHIPQFKLACPQRAAEITYGGDVS